MFTVRTTLLRVQVCEQLFRLLMTAWNYTYHNLEIARNKFSSRKQTFSEPLREKDPLWFDSRKRPLFALRVVVSGRLDCTTLTYLIVILNTSSVGCVSRRLLLSLRPGWGKGKGKTPAGEAYEIIKHPSNWLRLIAFLKMFKQPVKIELVSTKTGIVFRSQ